MQTRQICFHCGHTLPGGSLRFCPYCGRDLVEKKAANFAHYARILGPEARFATLEASSEEGEALQAYRQLFQLRYVSKGASLADRGLAFFQALLLESRSKGGFFRRRRLRRLYEKEQRAWEQVAEPYLAQERFNVIYLYIDLCRRDKGFNSLLFGLGQVKEETGWLRIEEQLGQVETLLRAEGHLPGLLAWADLLWPAYEAYRSPNSVEEESNL